MNRGVLSSLLKSISPFVPQCLLNPANLFEHGTVIISKSTDIFTNLAFEEWLLNQYQLESLTRTGPCLLFMWVNKPCIVVGRYQNPWYECHLDKCDTLRVPIVRRISGGGTVVHDENNINISFLTPSSLHNRRENMQLILEMLENRFKIECEINPMINLVLKRGQFKVSGSAARVIKHGSFHHCTLLVDVDLNFIHQLIKGSSKTMKNSGSSSIPASIINLREVNPGVNIENITASLAEFFCSKYSTNRIFTFDPTGLKDIEKIIYNYKSWEWIFGFSPQFELLHPDSGINMTVKKGVIHRIENCDKVNLSKLINLRFVRNDISRVLDEIVETEKTIEAFTAREVINELINDAFS